MKKLLATVLLAGALALAGCGEQSLSAGASQKKLDAAGYKTTLYSVEQAKAAITGLKFDGYNLKEAIYAEKGEEANKDILLAFYFSNINEANKFMEDNQSANMALMYDFAKSNLGENLAQKVGMHNNVAYVGSETSFAVAF